MDTSNHFSPEAPTIRPPSEWRSILVRVTRGCQWNRCRFCGIYPHLGVNKFSIRTTDDIKRDIDYHYARRPNADSVFLGDADPLQAGLSQFTEITRYIHSLFKPARLTCYARSSTLDRLGEKNIKKLGQTGLTRIHIGLESGNKEILQFQRKGQSPAMVKRISCWLKRANIEISFYVLLGLGGQDHWQEHIVSTADIINDTIPNFIRLRRLWLYNDATGIAGTEPPLMACVRDKTFTPQTPEGTVLELQLLLDQLDPIDSYLTCDHSNNYVRVSGNLQEDIEQMRTEVDIFLALPEKERLAYYHRQAII